MNSPMPRPHILFLMTDQCRADALGSIGGWTSTPHLDRIASEGITFTDCISTSPVCVPARLSLATGLYPHNTGVWYNCDHTMAAESPTWMQAIRDAGYRTSLFGKTHLHPHRGDLREREDLMHAYGWDDVDEIGGPRASARVLSHMTAHWEAKGLWDAYREDYRERFANKPWVVRPSTLPLEEYADVYVGQRAAEYLRTYDRSEPWCCTVSFGGPHEPWDTPEPYASRFDPAAMPAPLPFPEDRAPRARGKLDAMREKAPSLTPSEIAAMRADYAGNMALIDDQIGAILEVLEARGELDNTLILFTSDHGEMNGDCGLIYKSNFMQSAAGVPFIVRPPISQAIPERGSRSAAPVEWIDAAATCCDWAEAPMAHRQFARSTGPIVRGEATRIREYAVSELSGELMIQTEAWKLAINREGTPYLLFDRREDPEERTNLVNTPENATIQRELQLRLLEHMVRTQIHVDRRQT